MKRTILKYNSKLLERAKKLRKNSTLSEVLLWGKIKRKQIGYDFDRQRIIDQFIVDFYSKDLILAIEIDGNSHNDKVGADMERQSILEKLGVRFLRFNDLEVKNNLDNVIKVIISWINNNPLPGGVAVGRGG